MYTAYLAALCDPLEWDPYFDPLAHIPTALLGDMVHARLDPRTLAHK